MKNHLVVNSLGEVIDTKTGESIAGSCDIQTALETYDPELAYDPKHKGRILTNTALDDRVTKACQQAIRADLYRKAFKDAKWVEKVWELQELNDSFCRVWGRQGRIWASIEVINFVDLKCWWKQLSAQCVRFADRMYIMDTCEHMDRCSKDKGKTWIEGKDHGRMERQIAIEMELFMDDTLTQVRAKRKYLKKFFWKFYEPCGVAVC